MGNIIFMKMDYGLNQIPRIQFYFFKVQSITLLDLFIHAS